MAVILDKLAQNAADYYDLDGTILRDSNGNTVGTVTVEEG